MNSREINIFFIVQISFWWTSIKHFQFYPLYANLYRLPTSGGPPAEHQQEVGVKGNNFIYIIITMSKKETKLQIIMIFTFIQTSCLIHIKKYYPLEMICVLFFFLFLGPVVQSIVSLMSSLSVLQLYNQIH